MCKAAEASATHIDVARREGGAGLGQREVNDFCARDGARTRAGDGDGGRCGVGGAGVDLEGHLVVGLGAGPGGRGADVGVQVLVARHVGELGVLDAHAATAAGARCGRVGGGVAGVAGGGRARGRVGLQAAHGAAHGVDVAGVKAGRVDGFAEGEGDALGARHGAGGAAGAGDDDGGGGGVGAEGGADEVVGLKGGACRGRVGAGVAVGVAARVAEGAAGHADGGVATGVGRGGEGDGVLGVTGGRAAAGEHGCKTTQAAARGHQVGGREVARGLGQGDVDRLSTGEGLGGGAAGTGNGHGGRGGVGVDAELNDVVGFLCGARHAALVGVQVRVAGRVGELATGHRHRRAAHHARGGREGGGVLGVAGAGVAAGEHGRKAAQAAAGDVDVAGNKVGAGLRQREGDGLGAGDHARAAAVNGDGGGGGVGHQGVEVQADLVVGLQGRAARSGADIGVGVVVARHIGKGAGLDAHGGDATAVGGGREDGSVLGVAIGGVATAGHGGKAAQAAALHVDVALGEGGAGLAEREVNRLAGADHARACAADHDGGRGGVGQLGVVGDVDDVVGLDRGARDARHVGVEVGVVAGVGELARLHTNACQASAVAAGREGCGVVGVTSAGAAAGEHGRKVGERAAHHVDIGQAEGGAGLRQDKGDLVTAARSQAAAALAAERNLGRGGVGGHGVVGQCDLVVGLVARAAHKGVGVLVACVVAELARGDPNGCGARAIGGRREAGGELGVACTRRAAGGHRGEGPQRAARDHHIAQVKVHRGFRQCEGDGLVGPIGQGGACVGAGHDDRGRSGVGWDGVVGEADLVVGLQHRTGRRWADVGVRVEVARRIGKGARFDPDGGCARRVGRGCEAGAVDAGAHLRPIAQGATGDVHIALTEGGARLRQREGDRGRLTCAQTRLVQRDRHAGGRGVGRGRVGAGVIAQADLVVGLQRGARRRGAHVGVCVGIAAQVGELARSHPDGGRAIGIGCRCEGGRVLLVAGARSARGHWHQVGDGAARHVDVGQREGAAGL